MSWQCRCRLQNTVEVQISSAVQVQISSAGRCSKPGRAEFPARAENTVRTRQGIHWNVTRREQPPDLEDWHREIRNTRETTIWQRITERPARYRQCRRATPVTVLIARQVLGNADKHNERVHPIDEHRMSTQIHEPWHESTTSRIHVQFEFFFFSNLNMELGLNMQQKNKKVSPSWHMARDTKSKQTLWAPLLIQIL